MQGSFKRRQEGLMDWHLFVYKSFLRDQSFNFRCTRNRTGRADQDSSGDDASVCTSTSMARAARARSAQRNPSTPAQLRAGWRWDQDQLADEKPYDTVLAATARNERE